jgi:type VI secretion system secreted protein VgrG
MALTQANRFIGLETPLGADVLAVRNASCTEEVSRLFQVDLDIVSTEGAVSFEDIIGESVTLRINAGKDQKRYLNGIVSRFVQTKNEGRNAHYRATVVPWLWLLTRTSDCRIFQKKSIPDIIEEVFKGHGLDAYKLCLSGSYAPWDFCVQYRETDFNFVSRLMEQEGIYYFFEHEDGKHTLVLADSPSAHETYSGYETIIYRPPTDNQPLDRECVTDWVVEKELKPGAYALNDFYFKTPKASLRAKASMERDHAAAAFEVYDYPGEYEEHGDGEKYAKTRIEELQATYETLHAQATARGVCPGYLFTLQDHPREDQNREYLITSASCQMDAGDFELSGSGEANEHFSCSFTCSDSQSPFRPIRRTPKPLVQGPQTAIVVGPAGEIIHTDEFGRIKVQFHWDRYGKKDDNASCWIRVSQNWGGKNWGGMFIPHVGQEVIVSFEEGDPDRPIITGRVYNADQMPPIALPDGKTKSIIRDHGTNEIIMEGKAGEEYIQMKQAYGNELKMDAKEKTIRMYCPTHGTELIMGKSINWATVSDWIQKVGGNASTEIHGDIKEKGFKNITETFLGRKHDTVIGARTEMTCGTKTEVNTVNQNVIVVGVLCEFFKGWKVNLNKVGRKNKTSELQELINEHNEFIEKNTEKYEKCLSKVKELTQESGKHKMTAEKSNWLTKGLHEWQAKKLYQKAEKMEAKAETAFWNVKDAKMAVDSLKIG